MYSRMLLLCLVAAVGCAAAQPAKETANMDALVEEMKSGCADGNDAVACMKFKVVSFLDTIFKKDNYQISESVEVTRNSQNANNDLTGRSSGDVFDAVENYIQTHDVTFKLPIAGAKVVVSPRNLGDDEIDMSIKFSEAQGRSGGVEPRKSKLKKIIVPILVFVLLKAMTLVPLALGVLGLKAWNALQLSFFSFVTSVALAVFQLCKKIASDSSHPPLSHGWDAATNYRARSFDSVQDNAQSMAYNAYV